MNGDIVSSTIHEQTMAYGVLWGLRLEFHAVGHHLPARTAETRPVPGMKPRRVDSCCPSDITRCGGIFRGIVDAS